MPNGETMQRSTSLRLDPKPLNVDPNTWVRKSRPQYLKMASLMFIQSSIFDVKEAWVSTRLLKFCHMALLTSGISPDPTVLSSTSFQLASLANKPLKARIRSPWLAPAGSEGTTEEAEVPLEDVALGEVTAVGGDTDAGGWPADALPLLVGTEAVTWS